MAVAMQAELMAGIGDAFELIRKRLIECPGTNQLVLMPKRVNSSSSRGVPTSPANRPREMSAGKSSPP